MNKVILIGKLTKEVEFHRTTKDLAIATMFVETSEKTKDQIRAQTHRVVAFGAVADICGSFLKEEQVYIEGRSNKNAWEKDGIKRYTTTVIVSAALKLGSGNHLGINKAIYLGRLGADPEIRYTNDGVAVAIMSLATNEKAGDDYDTQWHRIIAIGKLAEVCERYLEKGRQICIDGRIQNRFWKKNEKTFSITEVVAQSLEMLGSKTSDPSVTEDHLIASQSLDNNYMDDDIPF
jgi:single-strand DNA-binding protein